MNRLIAWVVMFLGVVSVTTVQAQHHGYQTLDLKDLSAFQEQAGNWQIVGEVLMDPTVSVHPQPAPQTQTKKKRKKRRKDPEPTVPPAVTFTNGTGILLNMNNEQMKDALLTEWEHSDIDLSLEIMLPKGSNSGIYLQGRYEVQLLDSWGVKRPKFSDIGGIYRNWESEPGKIYMGKAPLSNPSKAPGLWQKLVISFRAPKFDDSGKKIANAMLAYVDLNGVRIHENVEIPLPTGGPIENNESIKGPLMIQGDHGPVAFRNIQYRTLIPSRISLEDLKYQVFHGEYISADDLKDQKVVLEGEASEVNCEVAQVPDKFAIKYAGILQIPQSADYQFSLAYTGGALMKVDGKVVIDRQRPDSWWPRDNNSLALEAGSYPWELIYYKDAEWMPPRLALEVSTELTYPKKLHAFASYPPAQDPVSDIWVQGGNEVKLLRAFIDYQGDKSQRLTHTIGVSEPNGVNYVYDLAAGNLVCVWRGDFVDATPMWHDRGDGSFKPLGAAQYLMKNSPW